MPYASRMKDMRRINALHSQTGTYKENKEMKMRLVITACFILLTLYSFCEAMDDSFQKDGA